MRTYFYLNNNQLIALAKYEESYNCQYKDKFLKLLDIASKSSKVPMIILANLIRVYLKFMIGCFINLSETEMLFIIMGSVICFQYI